MALVDGAGRQLADGTIVPAGTLVDHRKLRREQRLPLCISDDEDREAQRVIGEQVKAARIRAGLSLAAVERVGDVNRETWARVERGEHRKRLTFWMLRRMARVVDCDLVVQFKGEDDW